MPGKQIALLIGNGKFSPDSGFASLRCPANDVRAMRDLLQDKVHADFQVTALVDASQREITKAIFDTLTKGASFEDTVLVYYSGHGCPDDDGSLFLAASDSSKDQLPITAVPTDFLCGRMRAAKSQRIFLILDCCFSGSIEKAFTKGEISDQVKSVIPKQFSGTGSYVLTASTDTQLAEEKEGDENSLLTKHILSGIKDGKADGNDDGIVTIHELVVHVQQAVPAEGAQRPWNFELRAGGGDMVFARTGLSTLAAKSKEVEEAVWKARDQYHVPMKTAQCIWSMISADELNKTGDAGRRRLNKLHSLIPDPSAFVSEIYDLAEAVQRAESPHPPPAPRSDAPPSQPDTKPQPNPFANNPGQIVRDKINALNQQRPSFDFQQPPAQFPPAQFPPQFAQVPAPKEAKKWSPLIVVLCVLGAIVGTLLCIGVGIGIVKGIQDSTEHSDPIPTSAMEPAKPTGIIFNFRNNSCGGTVYQVDDTHWMNALTGTCTSGNGPVFQVKRDETHVVLKGVNGVGYAYIPLKGGTVAISSTGPDGPWVAWGYAQRTDTHGDPKSAAPSKE